MKEKKLILATNNQHKVVEMKALLNDLGYQIYTLKDYPDIPEVIEDGQTLEENAAKKAATINRATGLMSLADDTGLEVECLEGAPGVYSSRFSGENATYAENNHKLLSMLKGIPWNKRKARFRCVMSIVENDKMVSLEGVCYGFILEELRGDNGFGYDPLFYVPEFDKSFAEMPLSVKNEISHRARALQKVRRHFENKT
ncbi:MAG: XTP/dITP diphosphatase [candidate division KSB1 bacterium]|jgi:XTP/dITP diphosphohydrolase|nr:XTP/dITP diphosphatase [candidate division KSB1 bacterium]